MAERQKLRTLTKEQGRVIAFGREITPVRGETHKAGAEMVLPFHVWICHSIFKIKARFLVLLGKGAFILSPTGVSGILLPLQQEGTPPISCGRGNLGKSGQS